MSFTEIRKFFKGKLFSEKLEAKPNNFDFEKIEGMLWGLAIGSALGNPTNSLSPEKRKEKFQNKDIENYELKGLPFFKKNSGSQSAATQSAFRMLNQIIEDGGFRKKA